MENQTNKFSFGKNWRRFLSCVNDQRLATAQGSMAEFMGAENIKGKTFIDIGCGSGIFSRSAFKLGALSVTSFDVDPFSVECCRYVWDKEGRPANWTVQEASILNDDFVNSLSKFQIVYSWGVLHHTGNMWKAISNAAKLVADGGYYYIAIYNKTNGLFGSKNWTTLKKIYNTVPAIGKRLMEGAYVAAYFIGNLLSLKNPFRKIKEFKAKRGMNWFIDVVDWLGGYPYEAATTEEILVFIKKNFPDFELINLKSTNTLGNNHFLFKRKIV